MKEVGRYLVEQVRANEDGNETTLHLGDDTVPLLLRHGGRKLANTPLAHVLLLRHPFGAVEYRGGRTVELEEARQAVRAVDGALR